MIDLPRNLFRTKRCFFDEITEFPEIATSSSFPMRWRFDVICSGSMLGVNYKKIESNSVGWRDGDMFSMTSRDVGKGL